ncbi:MAG: hypothetical protein CR972_01255 [Candidatus Moraniibacteriota bacterium]|nr:MAG: hypothetical protein CR972_01255 [Candidatus Moranbacteria bacterium]
MHYNISKNSKEKYIIKTPGEHIFYFENLSARIQFIINAENIDLQIYGLYQGTVDKKFDLSITQIHNTPNSQSTTLIKSILDDHSKLHFTGKIRIEKKAKNSKALLTNKNLLLNKKASVISIPQLEVLPHEVECTHSAITTTLDHAQLNYLVARGLSKKNAKKLLLEGFIQDVFFHKNYCGKSTSV